MPRKKEPPSEKSTDLEVPAVPSEEDHDHGMECDIPTMDAELCAADEAAPLFVEPEEALPLDDADGTDDGGAHDDVPGDSKNKVTRPRRTQAAKKSADQDARSSNQRPHPAAKIPRLHTDDVLSIDAREGITSEDDADEAAWHEVYNAYRIRRFLTGTLCGVEETPTNKTIAVLDYKGLRVVIPMREMMLHLERAPAGGEYVPMMRRKAQVLSTMLGAELDFVVKGLDSKSRAVVASRKEAMLRKRQTFYMGTGAAGTPKIYAGRVVQARVIAVAEKVVRVEVFGVECTILARDLSWDWIGDARERFSVGDKILVRIQEVDVVSLEDITIQADVRSVSNTTSRDRLKQCRMEGRYAGTVTDVRKGVVYIRLSNGVNAIAHTCYDYRMPGKKDTVSFVVTKIDMEGGIATGIISRIIKQNL